MKYTTHALFRMNERLNTLVEQWEISKKIYEQAWHIPAGRSYLIVKKFSNRIAVSDPDVQPDGIARGDMIVAVLDNRRELKVTTVLLRKSSSVTSEYKYINSQEFGL